MPRVIGRLASGLVLAVAVASASCQSNAPVTLPESGATLEGTVTYGKDQLAFAMVMVQGPGGTAAQGKIGEDGKYKVENCPVGEVTIGVNTAAAQGDHMAASMAGGSYKGPEAKAKGKAAGVPPYIKVPDKFFDPKTSGLKTTVKAGSNTYDITIPK